MSFCPNCGAMCQDTAAFCPNCGNSLVGNTAEQAGVAGNYSGEYPAQQPVQQQPMPQGYPVQQPMPQGYPAGTALANGVPQKNKIPGWVIALVAAVVVVILSLLLAVAVPTFTAALEKSRQKTDLANARALKAIVFSQYMSEEDIPDSSIDVKATIDGLFGDDTATFYLYQDGKQLCEKGDDAVCLTSKEFKKAAADEYISVTLNKDCLLVSSQPPMETDEDVDSSSDDDVSDVVVGDSANEDGTYDYTTGSIQAGYWVNPWANMRLKISDDWKDWTDDFAAKNEEDNVDVGLALTSATGDTMFAICFVDTGATEDDVAALMPSEKVQAIDKVLDVGMQSGVASANAKGLGTKTGTTTIAGEEYRTIEQTAVDGTGNRYVMKLYGKFLGTRIVFLELISSEKVFDEEILESIQTEHFAVVQP